MLRITLACLLTSLLLTTHAQPANDNLANAIDVTALIGGCSSNAAYTTANATGDQNAGSCWNNAGPAYNVWFSFTAPASGSISATIDIGSSKGTMARTQAAIWQSDGTTQVACKVYQQTAEDVVVETLANLTPGDTYYISVDTYNATYVGTFTLCLSNEVSYDYFEGATDVTSFINTCSPNAAYSTVGGTPDGNKGSCWNNSGPLFNRWFYFTAATSSVSIKVDIGGTKGTQERSQVALWEADGNTQVACRRFEHDGQDVVIDVLNNLTPGNTYYISVDSYNTSYDGTFTLCLSDQVSNDYFEGATDVTAFINSCTADAAHTTIGATPDKNAGSCWNNSGPLLNRWFSFTATTTSISATIDIAGTKGTARRTQAAIWESDGITEIACSRYLQEAQDVVVDVLDELTPGNTYYLSVDSYNASYDGTFTLCLSDQVSYDYYEGAEEITDIYNWCSSDEAYSTIGATADQSPGSCWNNSGPKHNRWFYFDAVTDGISVKVDIDDTRGTQRRTEVALWEDDGTTELACRSYQFDAEDVTLDVDELLIPGNRYYISVDTYNTSYDGTFTLCVDDNPSYDFYSGALEITDLNDWCSSDAAYTTIGASGDRNKASCWNNSGPRLNRWFKFTAISSEVNVTVDIGSGKGTQRRTQLALWEADGTTQVVCAKYSSEADDVSVSTSSAVIGNDYYISVDSYNTAYDGTFTLCVSNIDDTFYSIASGDWDDPNNWSFGGHGGVSAGDYPQEGDIVYIEGHEITISTNENAAEVNINVAAANTSLTIDGAILDIDGQLNFSNSGSNVDGEIEVVNGGLLDVQDDLAMTRSGGSNVFAITVSGTSSILINQDLLINSTGGATIDNTVTLSSTATLEVLGETVLNTTSGMKSIISLNNSSIFTAGDEIYFTADGTDLVEIELNDNSQLNLGSGITRGAPAYGILDANDNSIVAFNSTTNLQVWPSVEGESSDGFNYVNVLIDNSRITYPQVTLEGDVSISGTLTLTDGIVQSSSGALLILLEGASLAGGGADSFIDGPLQNIGNESFEFPVGDGNVWAPAEVFGLVGADANTAITVEYNSSSYSNREVAYPDASGENLLHISNGEFWAIDVDGNLTSSNVTFHWKDASRSNILDYGDLRMANYSSGDEEWDNLGADVVSSTDPGYITINNVTDFGSFTFGSTSTNNPLPVELIEFSGEYKNGEVRLFWFTASETNNDFFEIQTSYDGIAFENNTQVSGSGTVSDERKYEHAFHPAYFQPIYCKLSQTDYDGTTEELGIIRLDPSGKGFDPIYLYPNPSEHGVVKMKLPENYDAVKLSILSVSGQVMLQRKVEEPGSELFIHHSLTPGIYTVVIEVSNYEIRKKLIVK